MDQNKQQLQELIATLESFQPTEEGLVWLNDICSVKGEQSIINQLVNTFLSNLNDIEYINSILRCLKKLNDLVPQLVQHQILSNELFPKAMVKYFTQISINNYIADGLIMLALIFQEKKFNKLADDKFANALLNALEFVDNEAIFQSITLIIVKLSDQPKVIEVCLKHNNIRFLQEYILQYLNKSSKDIIKPLMFIEKILQADGNFFYPNDFKVLQELSIRYIQDGEEQVRQLYIRNLFVLVSFGNKELLKKQEIIETMEMVKNNCKDVYSLKKASQVLDLLK